MKSWQTLLEATESAADEKEVFNLIEAAARELGWDYCAYGLRLPWPLSSPKIVMVNNYSPDWQKRYHEAGYLSVDPTVLLGLKSQQPILWTETIFTDARDLWEDAKQYGLNVGWAQSCRDANGLGGMLSLSRSGEQLTQKELDLYETDMRWLVHVAHMALSKSLIKNGATKPDSALTSRELEILKWTADGKSAQEISDILKIAKYTVEFHIKNAAHKLQAANKTAAVVKAVTLGLLN